MNSRINNCSCKFESTASLQEDLDACLTYIDKVQDFLLTLNREVRNPELRFQIQNLQFLEYVDKLRYIKN